MKQMITLAGWLLVTTHGGTIAWYEKKQDCIVAESFVEQDNAYCVPDRFLASLMKPKPDFNQ